MGSISNPNFLPDCSQPICTAFCPQWCYIIFPPPPSSDDDDGATNFSPLIVALIGILTGAFLLVAYYTIISKYCKRTRRRIGSNDPDSDQNDRRQEFSNSGLDEASIKSIAVCKYGGDGFIEGTECAVCLSEFELDENLRVLPKCSHAFHLPCIDTWLKSHSNCPLCRANVVSVPNPVVQLDQNTRNSSGSSSRTDLILVVAETESVERITNRGVRRSVSFHGQFLVSDMLLMNDEEMGMRIQEDNREPRNNNNGGESANVIRRSVSTGRFTFTRHNKRSALFL